MKDHGTETYKLFPVFHPTTGERIFLEYGLLGFLKADTEDRIKLWDSMYDSFSFTEKQAAMAGSMFGWDVRLAKPAVDRVMAFN